MPRRASGAGLRRPPHQIPVEEPEDDDDRDPTTDPTIREPRSPNEETPIRLPPGR